MIFVHTVSCGEFLRQTVRDDWNSRKETRSNITDLPNKPEERLRLVQEPLQKGSTIIYVPTRKGTLSIANYLCRCGVKAAAYNAAVRHGFMTVAGFYKCILFLCSLLDECW